MTQTKNSLQRQTPVDKVIEYESSGQKIKLSLSIIKKYLTSGGGNISDEEAVMFLNLCRYQKLNPFLREAYLIKYGNSPATIVTGKDVFTKRAFKNNQYAGQQAGIYCITNDNVLKQRTGTLILPNENLVGGWAKVFIKGYDVPVEITVSLGEHIGTKSDGTVNKQWATKPATMIRKVALVQALREAFPEDFQGLYSQEEIPTEAELPVDTIELKTTGIVTDEYTPIEETVPIIEPQEFDNDFNEIITEEEDIFA